MANSATNSAVVTLYDTARDIPKLKTDLSSLITKVDGIESTLTKVKNDLLTTMNSLKKEEEEGSSWNPLTWFGGDDEEGFTNKDNNLFFILVLIIILYYSLKR